MSVDIGGLGEQNISPFNVFHMMDEFNVQYSRSICEGLTVVVKESNAVGPNFRHIGKYRSLPQKCAEQIKPLAEFIGRFNSSCDNLRRHL